MAGAAVLIAVAALVAWTAWGVISLATDARETSSFLSYLAEQRELDAVADGVSFRDRQSLRAEAAAAQQIEAQVEVAVAQSISALSVLVVTALYVGFTYQLVRQARSDHSVALAALAEMRLAREQELTIRQRDRSESAALRALGAIRRSNIRSGRGEPEQVKIACPELHAALEAEVPFVSDEEVARRLDACQESARVFGWPAEQFRGYNHALASIRIREIVTVTRSSLEAFVAGRALPDWRDLPERASAMTWILGPPEEEP